MRKSDVLKEAKTRYELRKPVKIIIGENQPSTQDVLMEKWVPLEVALVEIQKLKDDFDGCQKAWEAKQEVVQQYKDEQRKLRGELEQAKQQNERLEKHIKLQYEIKGKLEDKIGEANKILNEFPEVRFELFAYESTERDKFKKWLGRLRATLEAKEK